VDLDADGHSDILSGSYSRMSQPMAGLFQVLWGQPDKTFKAAAVLTGTDNEPLIIPADSNTITQNICTRPTAVDWDADGDLDLVVGNFEGTFYLFSGEGPGRFSPKPEIMLTDNGPLRIQGAHSDPFPVDWDRDGDLDLLSGSSNGGVEWAENLAGPGKLPALAPFRPLIEVDRQIAYGELLGENELTGPTGSTRVWVDDVNADGKLDVLVGDSVTLVALPEGISKEESQKRQAQWQAAILAASEAYNAAANNPDQLQKALAKLQEVHAQRAEFIREERTGFVWLYLQK
jgi:hypothetical protein